MSREQSCVMASAGFVGDRAYPMQVRIGMADGMPGLSIAGVPDATARDMETEVRCAIRRAGYELPHARIEVTIHDGLVGFDGPTMRRGSELAIAAGILVMSGQVPEDVGNAMLVGELGLRGEVLPATCMEAYRQIAEQEGLPLVCSSSSVVGRGGALGVTGLDELTRGLDALREVRPTVAERSAARDMGDILGQREAKRILAVGAATGLGVLLRTDDLDITKCLAAAMPQVMGPMTQDEQDHVWATAGLGAAATEPLPAGRPFRSPHHSITPAGMIGGGRPVVAGEVSLASHGVLHIEDVGRWTGHALDMLRPVMGERAVNLVRAQGIVRMDARCLVVADALIREKGPGQRAVMANIERAMSGICPLVAQTDHEGNVTQSTAELGEMVERGRAWRDVLVDPVVERVSQERKLGVPDVTLVAARALAAMEGRGVANPGDYEEAYLAMSPALRAPAWALEEERAVERDQRETLVTHESAMEFPEEAREAPESR